MCLSIITVIDDIPVYLHVLSGYWCISTFVRISVLIPVVVCREFVPFFMLFGCAETKHVLSLPYRVPSLYTRSGKHSTLAFYDTKRSN